MAKKSQVRSIKVTQHGKVYWVSCEKTPLRSKRQAIFTFWGCTSRRLAKSSSGSFGDTGSVVSERSRWLIRYSQNTVMFSTRCDNKMNGEVIVNDLVVGESLLHEQRSRLCRQVVTEYGPPVVQVHSEWRNKVTTHPPPRFARHAAAVA